jgi:hypothetical protein
MEGNIKCPVEVDSSGMIYTYSVHTKFHHDQFRYLSNITIITATNMRGCNVGTSNRRELMESVIEMAAYVMIYEPSLLKIYARIQAILRFFQRNLRGCNIVITEEREL